MSETDRRNQLAEFFRRRTNGIYADEWEYQHERRGLDPMTCNDFICLRAVADADAVLPLVAAVWDDGYLACMDDAWKSEMDDPTPNPYRGGDS